MASKGNKRHMKSLQAPRYYGVHRKETAYVAKPNPGRHTLGKSVSLVMVAVRLGVAKSAAEARRIIKEGAVSVNGEARRDPYFPVGINDLIALKGGDSYAVSIDERGKVAFNKGASDSTHYKIVGKYKAANGTIMARLHDGSVIKIKGDGFKVGDSVLVDSHKAFKAVVPLKEGSECFVIDGVHTGARGKIAELKKGNMHAGASAVIEQGSGSRFETLVRNIIIIG